MSDAVFTTSNPVLPFPSLAKQAEKVKTTFDGFAVLIAILGIIGAIALWVDENPSLAILVAVATIFNWAWLRLAGIIAGHVANKNT